MLPKIFIVGTACTGITDAYDLLCQKTGFPGCNEKHTNLVIECVIRNTVPVESVLKTYRAEKSTIDKTHLNLWLVERLAEEFPDAVFVMLKRNVNIVISQMLRMQSIKDWCIHYAEMGVTFPSHFLGAERESDYTKLNLKDRCKARIMSHYAEIDRLATVLPLSRFVVLNYDDKQTFDQAIDRIVSLVCTQPVFTPTPTLAPPPSVAAKLKQLREHSIGTASVTTTTKATKPQLKPIVVAPIRPNPAKITPVVQPRTVSHVSPLDRKLDPPRVNPMSIAPPRPVDAASLPAPVQLNISPDQVRTDYVPSLKFFWINLERATQRKQRMQQEFEKRSIQHKRVNAFDGQVVDFRPLIESKIPHTQLLKHKLEIATSLSHLKALHAFVLEGDDVGIICEDDLSFEYETLWKKSLQEMIAAAPQNWQVLQLGLTINIPKEWHNIMESGKTYLPRKAHWYSALAYAVKRSHAISVLTEHGISCTDKQFASRFKINNIEQAQSERIVIGTGPTKYLVYPPVFTYPSQNDSYIHPQHLRMHESSKNMIAKAYLNNR